MTADPVASYRRHYRPWPHLQCRTTWRRFCTGCYTGGRMSCLDPSAVQGYVDGALAGGERVAAEAHLECCEACRRLVDALAMTNAGCGTPPMPTVATNVDSQRGLRSSAPPLGSTIDRYRLDE